MSCGFMRLATLQCETRLQKCIRMEITIFKIFIWGGINGYTFGNQMKKFAHNAQMTPDKDRSRCRYFVGTVFIELNKLNTCSDLFLSPELMSAVYMHGSSKANFLSVKNAIIFLPSNLNVCFGCSKEPSHPDVFFEYPQHMRLV